MSSSSDDEEIAFELSLSDSDQEYPLSRVERPIPTNELRPIPTNTNEPRVERPIPTNELRPIAELRPIPTNTNEPELLLREVGVDGLLSMSVPVKRAVVKLIGKDGSGKTSLLKSFKRLMFSQTQDSSPAIQIETLQLGNDSDHWQKLSEHDIQKHLTKALMTTVRKVRDKKSVATTGSKSSEEKEQSSDVQHINRKTLEKQFLDLLKTTSFFAPRMLLQVCDHGGQEDFFATSSTFASSSCICIMTLNVTEDLEAEAHSFVRQTDRRGFQHDKVKLHRMKKNKDWINHHLSVISVSQQCDTRRDDSEASCGAGSNTRSIGHVFDTSSPPVIFAATHADQLPKGKEQEVIRSRENELQKVLGGKRFSNHVYRRPDDERSELFFCIDNTKSRPPSHEEDSDEKDSDEEDSEVVKLRKLIMSAVEKHAEVHPTPATSLLLEEEVYKMRKNAQKKIIPLKDTVALAQEKCGLQSESDIISAVNDLHKLHIVIYFALCEVLSQYVFIDAPWLFTTLSRLNSLKCIIPIREGRFNHDVSVLQEDGIMSQDLCFHLLDNPNDGALTQEAKSLMVKAAEMLDILTPHERETKQDETALKDGYVTEYFVPGALQEDDDEAPQKLPPSPSGVTSPIPLVLRPENVGMFIEALFFGLITRCVRHYKSHLPYLRRNHVIFHMSNGCDIELFYLHDYVVVVLKPNWKLPYEEVRKSCVETREFIVSQLEDVKKQGLSGFQFSICFQHLTGAEDQPFVPIQDKCLVRLDQYPQSERLFYINKKSVTLTREDEESVAIWFPTTEETPTGFAVHDRNKQDHGEEERRRPSSKIQQSHQLNRKRRHGGSSSQQLKQCATEDESAVPVRMKRDDELDMTRHIDDKQILAISAVARNEWQEIGISLGFEIHELSGYEHKFRDDLDKRLRAVLFAWKDREDNPAVGKVVEACQDAKVGAAVRRALQKLISGEAENSFSI